MGTRPEEIRQEISATRRELAADVDRLADKTSPSRIMRRRTHRMGRAARTVREKVMGTPTDVARRGREQARHAAETIRGTASDVADTAKSGMQQAAETVRATPQQAMQGTQGNPMAAGLIAFGAGLLASTLIPATEAEQRTAEQLKEGAGDVIEPIKQAVQETGQAVGEQAKEDVKEAAQQVKQTATEAAKATGQQARDQARNVADQTGSGTGSGS